MEKPKAGKAWPALSEQPRRLCAVIFLAGWALFLFGITSPDTPYWDEVNYVPAVRAFLNGVIENREHPPLAKELMSLGMLAFGDNPLGWRFMTSLFGALSLVGIYLWSLALFRQVRPALLAVMFTAVNQVLYVESRSANLDIFMLAFMLGGLAAFTASWHAATPGKGPPADHAGRRLLRLVDRVQMDRSGSVDHLHRYRRREAISGGGGVRCEDPRELDWYAPGLWSGIGPGTFLLGFGAIPLVLYYLTFLPTYGVIPLPEFIEMHVGVFRAMANSHQDPILLSNWTSWPFARHPNYFMFTPLGCRCERHHHRLGRRVSRKSARAVCRPARGRAQRPWLDKAPALRCDAGS